MLEGTPSTFLKNWQKIQIKKTIDLETKLKHLEKHYQNYAVDIDYKVYKQQVDAIY